MRHFPSETRPRIYTRTSANDPARHFQCCGDSDLACANKLDDKPRCSGNKWNLFENYGYFCCPEDYTGYNATKTGTNGCAAPDDDLTGTQEKLPIISEGPKRGELILHG